MKEEYFDTFVPVDEAGFSKYIAAKQIERMDNAIELRIFSIFGKYEDYAIRFISNEVCKAVFDLSLTIKQNRLFDFLYIDDLMPVLEHFMIAPNRYKAYNVTPDRSIELYDVAKRILRIAGKDLPVKIAQEGMASEYSGDNARLKQEFPGYTLTPIDTAITSLYKWYEENKHTIVRDKLLVDK
jgi:GDP-L-fucose synthase